MKKKINLYVSDRGLRDQLLNLHFTDQVVVNENNNALGKLMKNINKNGTILTREKFNDKVLLKRVGEWNANVYVRKQPITI